jgi:hypothetical protein
MDSPLPYCPIVQTVPLSFHPSAATPQLLKGRRDSLHTEFGGSPLLQQGELDFSPAEKVDPLGTGFSPGFSTPALKRMIRVELFAQR